MSSRPFDPSARSAWAPSARFAWALSAALAWALLGGAAARAEAQAPEEEVAAPTGGPAEAPPLTLRGPQDGWKLQWSSRFGQGFGATVGDLDRRFVQEITLRTDFLFGRAGNRHIRIGPALDLRSANFSTFEAAAGGMALFPTHPGWPITLSALAGYAVRGRKYDDIGNGPVFVSTLGFGYRSYNYHGRYGPGIMFYLSSRVHLDNPSAFEITGGIELDFLLAYIVPALMIRMAAQRDDPDELVEDE